MNFSLGNWDNSLWNLLVGESGHRASWHYKDQFDAWYYGDSLPHAIPEHGLGQHRAVCPEGR